MNEIFGSHVKVGILLCLALRGGTSGRRLARVLKISPSQVFKALHQLVRAKILVHHSDPDFYALNPHYPFYDDLLGMVQKEAERHPRRFRSFLPSVAPERRVDPLSVYRLIALRGLPDDSVPRFSDILRDLYG